MTMDRPHVLSAIVRLAYAALGGCCRGFPVRRNGFAPLLANPTLLYYVHVTRPCSRSLRVSTGYVSNKISNKPILEESMRDMGTLFFSTRAC